MKKIYKIKVNSKAYEVELEEVTEASGSVVSSSPAPTAAAPVAASGAGETVSAPMPGTIVDVKVANGAQVNEGDVVAVLEAMKMETEILASTSGTVTSVSAGKGDQVNLGDAIVTIN